MRVSQTVLMMAVTMLLAASAARASPYWIAWEGDDFPENQGWKRIWGNWQGPYQGPGAKRTLEGGVLTYDSLYDPGVVDYSYMERPGQIDPPPGHLFVMEWRLKVEQVTDIGDPDVALRSDEGWALGLLFGVDRIYSLFEGLLTIPIVPAVFHEYRVVSSDMRTYLLYIDGDLARRGSLVPKFVQSYVALGDGVQGSASVHSWDYFRFGVVPEPSPAIGLLLVVAGVTWRRS
jgi:hypothetical protein